MQPQNLSKISFIQSQQIAAILRKMFAPQIKEFLIYEDQNYPIYFHKLINLNQNDYLYGYEREGKIWGFAHFKIINDELFLNNIAIHSESRSSGLGSKLLRIAVPELAKRFRCKSFSLDVFKKNTTALAWYKKMKMMQISEKNWYNISDLIQTSESFDNSIFKIENDPNGFKGLYFEGRKIATIINSNLIITDYEYLNLLSEFKSMFSKGCFISNADFKYPLLDKSLRLRVELNKIKL